MWFILRAVALLLACQIATPATEPSPVLAYLTNFGRINAIATDAAGNVYLAGATSSPKFPLVNAFRSQPGEGNCSIMPSRSFQACGEAFAAKLDPTGTRLIYSTYLAGFGRDHATAISVDASGSAYIAGDTDSGDFPGSDPAEKRFAPIRTFAVKLSADGELVWARLFPAGSVLPAAIAAGGDGGAVVAGATEVSDFPTVNALPSKPVLHPVYVTSDRGLTWRGLSFAEPVRAVYALAVDPRRPAALYAATDLGLYKSTDSGASWTLLYRDPQGTPVIAAVLDYRNPDTLYAAANAPAGSALQPNLLKSTDAGVSFRSIPVPIEREFMGPLPAITTLAIDPVTSGNLWLSASGAIYRSTDAGEHWQRSLSVYLGPLLVAPPSLDDVMRSQTVFSRILFDQTNPRRIYACCISRPGTGLFRTDDGGTTWIEGARGPIAGSGGPTAAALDPRNGALLYAPYYHGLARSRDAGMTWAEVALPEVYLLDRFVESAFGPDGNLYVLSNTGLVLRSADDARTWTASYGPWSRQYSGDFRDVRIVAFSPADSATFYVSAPVSLRKAFIARLDPAGGVVWSTLLGGSGEDVAAAVALDNAGDVWIAGTTSSKNFPVVAPLQATRAKALTGDMLGRDVFLTKLSSDGAHILYSTYLGGPGDDSANALAVDAAGNLYIGGDAGRSFPTANAMLSSGGSGSSGFVAKLDATGRRLVYSTYLDRAYASSVKSIAVGLNGAVSIAGCTDGDLTLVNPLDATPSGAFVATLNPSGTAFDFSTFFFGCGSSYPPQASMLGLALAPSGSLWVGGPAMAGVTVIGPDLGTPNEGYLARIDFLPAAAGAPRILSVRNAAGFQLGEVFAPGSLASIFGDNLAPSVALAEGAPLPRELAGASVVVAGAPAPLLYVSPSQINFQVPFEAPIGDAVLEFRRDGGVREVRRIRLVDGAPGLFTQSGDGRGAGVVMHASDFRLVTPENPAAPGEILALYATGLGAVTPPVPSGEAAPLTPVPLLGTANFYFYVAVDSRLQRTLYAGLAPGLVGVYQVNFVFDPAPGPGAKILYVSGSNAVTVVAR